VARENYSLASFNRGIVDRRGLARVDVKRVALAAEIQKNYKGRVLGSMMLRPGLQYLTSTASNAAARLLRFIFATHDTALLELTDSVMRVLIDDEPIERLAVSSAVTNGDFSVDVSGWTDNDEAGATSSWISPGYLQLLGDGVARAIRDQQVSVAGADQGIEHALRIEIAQGPVYLRVGSTSGGDEYVGETALGTGTHSLAFTPTGNFFIRFFSSLSHRVWVDSVNVEAAGVMTLPTPWTAALLSSVRYEQSADVLFVACETLQQRRIERRGTRPGGRSWSIVLYAPEDGPFGLQNVSPTTLTPSALVGSISLTASQPTFKASHVGALFSLTSAGQTVSTTAAASGIATNSIRVTGIDRTFSVEILGDNTLSTVDLQRSYDNVTWATVGAPFQWTADVTGPVDDELTNQIVYYRLNLTTRIAPDSVTMTLRIGSGSVRGIVRIASITSELIAGADVLVDLGSIIATDNWQEGQWSDVNGYPSAVRLYEGRLWWIGLNGVWASVSDAYDSFDETVVGDAGPINRTIGAGPVDNARWILAVQRLIFGTDGDEQSIRSSSIDEPITPSNFHMKSPSSQGSADVDAVKTDQTGYFVNRSGKRVYEMAFDVKNYDYTSNDATALCPDLGRAGIVRMDVQRQPDTRVHCVRADGVVMVMTLDTVEEVRFWETVETLGAVEDVCVLPALDGDSDDQVYYVVRRTINGAAVRYIEKWAQEIDCLGDQQLCMLADSFVTYSGSPTSVITGLAHLEGKSVVVWADGADVGTDDTTDPANWTQIYTVTGGQIALAVAASNVVVGLPYTAQFRSAKLGLAGGATPTPLGQHKRVVTLGLLCADVHRQGVQYGADFDHLDSMPGIEEGAPVTDEVRTDYDVDPVVFPGKWSTDERLCLQSQAPRPATILAATIDMLI
jgi:hypothetical protein